MLNIFQKDKTPPSKSSNSDSQSNNQDTQPQIVSTTPKLLYPKPKILLIDMKDESAKILKSAGYKIDVGTFGESYKTEKSEYYENITLKFSLPNVTEQEIIIIDLESPEIKDKSSLEKENAVVGNKYFWVKRNLGVIDSRPSVMSAFCNSFDNILKHGGIFIVFADSRTLIETVYATKGNSGFYDEVTDLDNWSFLSIFNRKIFNANYSDGTEISVKSEESIFYKCLKTNIKNAHFKCTLEPKNSYTNRHDTISNYQVFNSWIPTVTDKYGNAVAGAITPNNDFKGSVFIFPQIEHKSAFLLEFLRDVLPELIPNLFPYSKTKNWLEKNEYQPIIIQNLNRQIEDIESEAKKKIEKIYETIEKEKEKTDYQNKLLTDDGDSLVETVEQTLKVLGFVNVINVDEEYKKQEKTNSNDEDLQIRDKPTSLLIEVKGVAGFPSDNDSRQITKHIPIRMKEWQEFDVKALSIINHQKAIPALDRDKKPFRPLIVESAEEQYLGLMTTDPHPITGQF